MLGKRPGESLAKAAAKKKPTKTTAKKDVIKMVPEADRVFAGKTMYWIPDDDIDQGRKMRIDKTREYGGLWSKNVSYTALKFMTPVVTHGGCQQECRFRAFVHICHS